MSDNTELNESSFAEEPATDDRAPLALALGLVTALVAGGLWAVLTFVTGLEIGYAAWGVGLLVGIAMSRVTNARTRQLAYAAAGFAVLGLLAGKIFIFAGSTGRIATELAGEDDAMKTAVAWQLYYARELSPATLEELDRAREAGDTLSDAVWESMREQASTRLVAMTDEEKHEAATGMARGMMQQMGVVGGITAQLSLFDLLWVLLAVGTAYRMLAPVAGVPEVHSA
jgi:Trk-type K+ transport system membrane component